MSRPATSSSWEPMGCWTTCRVRPLLLSVAELNTSSCSCLCVRACVRVCGATYFLLGIDLQRLIHPPHTPACPLRSRTPAPRQRSRTSCSAGLCHPPTSTPPTSTRPPTPPCPTRPARMRPQRPGSRTSCSACCPPTASATRPTHSPHTLIPKVYPAACVRPQRPRSRTSWSA
jgi:hypothetical protein